MDLISHIAYFAILLFCYFIVLCVLPSENKLLIKNNKRPATATVGDGNGRRRQRSATATVDDGNGRRRQRSATATVGDGNGRQRSAPATQGAGGAGAGDGDGGDVDGDGKQASIAKNISFALKLYQ